MIRLIVSAAVLAVTLSVLPGPRAQDAPGWKLVWSDEFNGETIDRRKWDFDIGNGFYNYDAKMWISGWGNEERQYYTREPENAFVKDGMMHLVALKESINGCGYSSARLKTRKKDGTSLFSRAYGKFEFRAKLPTGKGIWPALWLLPLEDKKYGTWAASGEIDVMEAKGHEPNKVHGTLHYGGRWPLNTHAGKEFVFPDKGTIADFHVYAVEWSPGRIAWSVDGKEYQVKSFWWSSDRRDKGKPARPTKESDLAAWPAPFDRPFFVVLNLAVGGRFAGDPDNTTLFPATMLVDYVRVYERTTAEKLVPRGEGKLPFGK